MSTVEPAAAAVVAGPAGAADAAAEEQTEFTVV
jgi:ribosomal protein L7/L12